MKELPYFKFYSSEWINGNVTLEDFYIQGVFINICAFYWFRSGKLTLSEIKRRLSKTKPTAFESLIERGLIVIENDNISIEFLDEQLGERVQMSKVNSLNGSLGGRPKSEKKATGLISLSDIKAKKSNIEEKREEENKNRREEKIVSLSDYEKLFDEIWKEGLLMNPSYRNKNLTDCIQKSYEYLKAGGRLARGSQTEFKSCVLSFMNNEREPKNNGEVKKVKLI